MDKSTENVKARIHDIFISNPTFGTLEKLLKGVKGTTWRFFMTIVIKFAVAHAQCEDIFRRSVFVYYMTKEKWVQLSVIKKTMSVLLTNRIAEFEKNIIQNNGRHFVCLHRIPTKK